MDGPSFADPLNDQTNSSIVDSSPSFVFRVSFPDSNELIGTRSPTNITCVNFYGEPLVLVLIVQIQLGVQDYGLQSMKDYVIVGPFYPRRRAVGSLLRYVEYGLGNDLVIFNVVTELLTTPEECSNLVYVLGSVHVPDRAQVSFLGFCTMF
jgi:hypothetical protein